MAGVPQLKPNYPIDSVKLHRVMLALTGLNLRDRYETPQDVPTDRASGAND